MGNLALKWMCMGVVMLVKQSLLHVCPKNVFCLLKMNFKMIISCFEMFSHTSLSASIRFFQKVTTYSIFNKIKIVIVILFCLCRYLPELNIRSEEVTAWSTSKYYSLWFLLN
jgi:hypothetical protein